jgi:hypothetical protein
MPPASPLVAMKFQGIFLQYFAIAAMRKLCFPDIAAAAGTIR